MSKPIPKVRHLFRGDINDAVIRVQQATGEHIDRQWWESRNLNAGTTEQILDNFDRAYEIELKRRRPGEYL